MIFKPQNILLILNTNSPSEKIEYYIDKTLFNVFKISSINNVIEKIREYSISLVILDLKIENTDGWKIIKLINSNEFSHTQKIPTILIDKFIPEKLCLATVKDYQIDRMLAYEDLDQLQQMVPLLLDPNLNDTANPSALVVEDYVSTACLIKKIIQHKFDVDIAYNGEEGLNLWKKKKHSLVLLDIMLPKMSGGTVLNNIIKIDPDQLVIIITAHGTIQMAQELMLSGASDFISKPFTAEKLRSTCEIVLKQRDFNLWNLCN